LGEKRHSKTIKTVHSTSQVLIVKVLSNNELKPEKALRRSSCVKCFKLCCYSFWQWVPRNDECAKPNSLYMEFCQDIRIMVAERKRVRRLVKTPAHPRVSLSRPTATGGNEEMLTQNYSSEEIILMWS